MRIGILAAGLACLGACYSPSYRDCEVHCASDTCPSGLRCDLGFCRLPGATGTCSGGDDARLDTGNGIDDAPPDSGNTCGWQMSPSNVDACAIPMHITDWTPSGTFNTGSAPLGQLVTMSDQTMARVVHASTVTITSTLTVTGTYPLIILADTVSMSNVISVVAGQNPAICPALAGGSSTYCGEGGPGGSFGGLGGTGGGCDVSTGTVAVAAANDPFLVPLRGGCNGGIGGAAGNTSHGGSGPAGGALQISARVSMSIYGTIFANGGGGSGGAGDGGDVCGGNSLGCSSGGGGGGSGGAILLESPMLTVFSSGGLCATGGGGGAGGVNSDATFQASGQAGTCGAGGVGGQNASGLGFGGAGGGPVGAPAGHDGGKVTGFDGGGGGGGGAGRIRVRTMSTGWQQAGAAVNPVPFEQ